MTLDVAALAAHLNMKAGDLDEIDQAVLPRLLVGATLHVEGDVGFKLDDATEFPNGAPEDIEHAVLLLAGHWYENREASIAGVAMTAIPFGYAEIIANHRTYTYG